MFLQHHIKTSYTPGLVIEGLRIGDQFIEGSKEELLKILEQSYEEFFLPRKAQILSHITSLLKVIETSDARTVLHKYELFEAYFLNLSAQNNQIPTSLLTILGTAGSQQQFVFNENIANSLGLGRSGHIYAAFAGENGELKKGFRRLGLEETLGEHLQDFIRTIQTQGPSGSKQTYEDIYYGRKKKQKYGNMADAYMQHIASEHAKKFKAILEGTVSTFKMKPVLSEIGETRFEQLLKDSLNNTRWTAGGDVIIIDPEGKVILNMQVKSATELNTKVVGTLSVKELKRRLMKIQTALKSVDEKGAKQFAQTVYHMYHNSAIVQNIDNAIGTVAENDLLSLIKI